MTTTSQCYSRFSLLLPLKRTDWPPRYRKETIAFWYIHRKGNKRNKSFKWTLRFEERLLLVRKHLTIIHNSNSYYFISEFCNKNTTKCQITKIPHFLTDIVKIRCMITRWLFKRFPTRWKEHKTKDTCKNSFLFLCQRKKLHESKIILNPTKHSEITKIDARYKFRLPNFFTANNRKMQATIEIILPMTVTKFGLIGVPSAFNTWMMYGCHTLIPENPPKICMQKISMNGFRMHLRRSSLSLSQNVGFGW